MVSPFFRCASTLASIVAGVASLTPPIAGPKLRTVTQRWAAPPRETSPVVSWDEVRLNDVATTPRASPSSPSPKGTEDTAGVGRAVWGGESVLVFHEVANEAECSSLVEAALACAEERGDGRNDGKRLFRVRLFGTLTKGGVPARGRACLEVLPADADALADALLLRVLARIDAAFPDLVGRLFFPEEEEDEEKEKGGHGDPQEAAFEMLTQREAAPSPQGGEEKEAEGNAPARGKGRDGPPSRRSRRRPVDQRGLAGLHVSGDLEFASREPAVNVYYPGGEFLPHKDHQALTVLVALSAPGQAFSGGGTSFARPTAPQDARSRTSGGRGAGDAHIVLRPPAGTAMVFGGEVTHSGVAVETGKRVVFVASFTRRLN